MNNFKFGSLLSVNLHSLLFSYALTLFVTHAEAFSEIPTSQVVSAGEEADFRCQYDGASFIGWTVNGSSNYPPDIFTQNRQTDDGLLSVLIITALPEYNGTLVQCVATVINGTSASVFSSPTALLLVINYTTPPPPPPNGFTISPQDQTVPEEVTSVFKCQHDTAPIVWRVNGEAVRGNESHIPSTLVNGSNIIYILSITAKPEFNNSVVECATFNVGQRKAALLKVQGTLGLSSGVNITCHANESCTASWGDASSLDITNAEPDVLYMIHLYRLGSACDDGYDLVNTSVVFETDYTFDKPNFPYQLLVTPQNNVQGAKSGKSEHFNVTEYKTFVETAVIIDIIEDTANVTIELRPRQMVPRHNLPVPSSFTLSLDALDGLGDMDSVDTITRRIGEVLTLDVPAGLPRHRLWNLIITPYSCQNDKLSVLGDDAELSTHDIQNISVTSPQPGEVRVTGDFIDGSTATGLLIIIYSAKITEYQLFQGRVNMEVVISDLLGGDYQVSVFVVEENGLPFSRAAVAPKQIAISSAVVNAENKVMKYPIEYKLLSNSTGVAIVCEFVDTNSITNTQSCIVVVHQRVDLLNSSGLLNIDSYIFTRDGDTASGFIEGLNLKEYQIGVIGGVRKVPPESNAGLPNCSSVSLVCVGSITASVVAGFVLIVIVVITCTVLGKRNRTHNENTGPEISVAGVQMKRCEAYEVTTLARKKITMEPNLAYEQVCIV